MQGNLIKDTRTLESISQPLTNLKIIYLQEFNGSGPNPVCSMKGLRERVFDILPQLKALDGYRKTVPVLDPGQINDDVEKPEYSCDEEWFNPDIYLTTIGKDMFMKAPKTTKEEMDFKAIMRECDNLITRKTNVLTL